MNIIRISTKGQIVIPSKMRRLLNIEVGDRFAVKRTRNEISLSPLVYNNLGEIFASVKAIRPVTRKDLKIIRKHRIEKQINKK